MSLQCCLTRFQYISVSTAHYCCSREQGVDVIDFGTSIGCPCVTLLQRLESQRSYDSLGLFVNGVTQAGCGTGMKTYSAGYPQVRYNTVTFRAFGNQTLIIICVARNPTWCSLETVIRKIRCPYTKSSLKHKPALSGVSPFRTSNSSVLRDSYVPNSHVSTSRHSCLHSAHFLRHRRHSLGTAVVVSKATISVLRWNLTYRMTTEISTDSITDHARRLRSPSRHSHAARTNIAILGTFWKPENL